MRTSTRSSRICGKSPERGVSNTVAILTDGAESFAEIPTFIAGGEQILASRGLSGVAVLVAAAFWTLLWGPIGLLLSTPLTMCLVVLGRHVEHLQFLEVLLGSPMKPCGGGLRRSRHLLRGSPRLSRRVRTGLFAGESWIRTFGSGRERVRFCP
jgi:hypothetical protein